MGAEPGRHDQIYMTIIHLVSSSQFSSNLFTKQPQTQEITFVLQHKKKHK